MPRSIFGLLLCITFSVAVTASAAEKPSAEISFEKHIRPILRANCFVCHGDNDEPEGGLDLRLRRLIAKGGESGPSLIAGKPEESSLLVRARDGEMPPEEGSKKLTAKQLSLIERWIAAGAPTDNPEPEEIATGFFVTDQDRAFWSFQPIERPAVPQVKHADRVRTPIDAFVLATLEKQNSTLSTDADKRTFIRRASVDLIGLLPTPEEITAFVADETPEAYEKLIDRLLDSPHYGERWGRHWLDVSGYADSEGYTNDDRVRSWSYKYRDYVIRAFNADKPFDEFVREQLAGDEMVKPPYKELDAAAIDKLVATGFLRMAPDGTGTAGIDESVARNEVVAKTVQIVSSSLLGMTVACAQCHHHRYDPISHDDYHRFRAMFEPAYDWKNWKTPAKRLVSLYTDADREKSKLIEAEAKKIDARRAVKQTEYIEATFQKELAKLPEKIREPIQTARKTPAKERTDEQKKLLKENPSVNVTAGSLYLYDRKAADDLKKIADEAIKLRGTKPTEEFIRVLSETPGKVPETFLFDRGDHEQPKHALKPSGLPILKRTANLDVAVPENNAEIPSTGRRLAYAKKITDGTHPLLARVLVNRFWLHHFGRTFVATPGDFGALGEKPTHPELLDWLASEFMDSGWSLKRLHKLIMMSSVYRQSIERSPEMLATDPENRYYQGMPIRRLEAEVLRDNVLAVSGKLNVKPFGPPVPVMADRVGQFVIGKENLNAGRPGAVIAMGGEEFRRSVFVQVRRSRPLAVLDTFDLPAMTPNCEARAFSTVAPQSLLLMNNDFIVARSEDFAKRIQQEAGAELADQVKRAWNLSLCRTPTDEELNEALAFLAEMTSDFKAAAKPAPPKKDKKKPAPAGPTPEFRALASFCQILISSNEFLYID